MRNIKDTFSCKDVLSHIDDFAKKGTMDPVLSGRMEGHLLFCDRCADEYGKALDREFAKSGVSLPATPSTDFVDKRLREEKGIFGFLWDVASKAKEEFKKINVLVNKASENWMSHPQLAPVGTLGTLNQSLGADSATPKEAAFLNFLYEPSGEKVALKVSQATPPQINPDGVFKAVFNTSEMFLEGRVLSLTLKLTEDQKLTFTTYFKKTEDKELEASFETGAFESPCLVALSDITLSIWPEGAKI
ncbi:MAG: hypothetical protein AB2L14_21765 [Candidatus Xenobiia bacterium LiM19]